MRGWLALLIATVTTAGCFEDRGRPTPTGPPGSGSALLTVQLVAPRSGITVLTGVDIVVQVLGRDLGTRDLTGIGFVARRSAPGLPMIDSAAVHFAARADSLHEFRFQIPGSVVTNTQVDVYGIAYGPGGQTRLSEAAHLTVVQVAPAR